MSPSPVRTVLGRASVVGLVVAATAVSGAAPAVASQDNTRLAKKLVREVSIDGVNRHLIAFQRFADRNGGNRASGTPGYDESARYVRDKLAGAGWNVSYQEFRFPFFAETAPAQLERLSPEPKVFTPGEEVVTYQFSGPGTVTGAVRPVDVTVPATPQPSSTSGCEAADFAGFPAGAVALVQRGGCDFSVKVANAVAAGATAVVIFNEGQVGRTEPFAGNLQAPVSVPVVGISYAEGVRFVELAAVGPVTARVTTSTISEERTTRNVIAETPGGRADNVVVAGAHLDSTPETPAINDNGSGSAVLLELGLKLADERVRNKVRLIFFAAEEFGLLGSEYYVSQLTEQQQLDIALYLNADMIASPNYARFVYDGDGSDGGTPPGPTGSAQIEQLFTGYFDSRGLSSEGTPLSGSSDYFPFLQVGIPVGGLFTGAGGLKTPEQAARYGGIAGQPYDECYHQACDNLLHIDRAVLNQNADAYAYAVGRFALDTSDVNGVSGKTRQRTSVLTRTAPLDAAAA